MINLLPTDMKDQIRYAKLNRKVLRYLWLVGVSSILLGGIFVATLHYQDQEKAAVLTDVQGKQQTIALLNKNFVPKAKDASDRLAAIKFVQTSQTRFSAVVADFAKVVPAGVSLDQMTLTGDEKVPLRMNFRADSYQSALAFRNALITSPRVAAADLETIASSGGPFQGSVVVAFKPGMAK